MLLGPLFEGVDADVPHGGVGVRVTDVTEDSRTALPGSLFIAREGTQVSGARFLDQAAASGAVAALVASAAVVDRPPAGMTMVRCDDPSLAGAVVAERFWGEPSRRLYAAAVTGTNGKSTVAHSIWRLLNTSGVRTGLIGTVTVDDGSRVSDANLTTPPATEISQTLSCMVDAGCDAVALEASSHALHQHRVAGLSLNAGVFTNLTGDHLDYHGTMEDYASAKAVLFEMLPESAVAVVNADDPAHERMIRDCKASVVRCSLESQVEATAEILEHSGAGMTIRFDGEWGELEVEVPLLGEHNAMNLLQGLAVAHHSGVSRDSLGHALSMIDAPAGRLERVSSTPGAPNVLIDFAHTDDALDRVLQAVRAVVDHSGELIVVFGCGGDRDRSKRARMGEVAARRADRIVITSDNPRTEDPSTIISDILEGIPAHAKRRSVVHADRARAIEAAIESAGSADLVLIAGKGHEQTQIIGDELIPFDDREVAARCLANRAAEGARS
ncbi:MAG: UDP-N-acetylmuramoyl-L-alanyl-D-glutamate--2,6-diaminopimelate ligase [Planctomycetota bacterium]